MIRDDLAGALLVVLLMTGPTSAGRTPKTASAENPHMNQIGQFGKPNPKAPAELSRFDFLIGEWGCEAKFRPAAGEWQTLRAAWVGRYVLDGYAIADEYRMTDGNGKLIVLGMNFRSYDAEKQTWNIKWLNAFSGTWTDLSPSELGGVHFSGPSVMYAFKEPVADHKYTRATYTSISKTHFMWRGEKSDDALAWSEFMVVNCYRGKK